MPEHDLGLLVTLNIGMTLSDILVTAIIAWAILRQSIRSTRELSQEAREGIREIATMQREVAFMIHRQYGDCEFPIRVSGFGTLVPQRLKEDIHTRLTMQRSKPCVERGSWG